MKEIKEKVFNFLTLFDHSEVLEKKLNIIRFFKYHDQKRFI